MKKLILLSLFLAIFSVFITAKTRTRTEATELANSFFEQSGSSMQRAPATTGDSLILVYECTVVPETNVRVSNPLYYVYNKANGGGFVIISGNDNATAILGYADSGEINPQEFPDGLKYWLDCFALEVNSLDNGVTTASSVQSLNRGNRVISSTKGSTPLLDAIKWNQSTPYNDLCPLIPGSKAHCVTGCVATAMAQVMKYYEWPATGTGSNSYTTGTYKISISEDFSKQKYNWENMTGTYGTTSTDDQKTAVATLMYHCGVAVDMNYASSSSAYSSDMAKALKNYFGYDENLQMVYRDYYNREEWTGILKTELNAQRPVLYAGQSSSGGHQFVCDGFDANNMFHINWGWGGLSNGYFQISALTPASGSTDGFNRNQNIVIGVQKPTSSSTPSYVICSNNPMSYADEKLTRKSTTTITINRAFNYGVTTFNGDLGLAIYDDKTLVKVVKSSTIKDLESGYGWSAFSLSGIFIPTDLKDGRYKMYGVYKPTDSSDWQIIRGKVGTANFLYVDVTYSSLIYSVPTDVLPELFVKSLNVESNLYQNKKGIFNVEFSNQGSEFNSQLAIKLTQVSDNTVSQIISTSANIESGQTKIISFTENVTIAPGDYQLSILCDPTNTGSSSLIELYKGQTVTVESTPAADAKLSISSALTCSNSSAVNKNNAVFSISIYNASGVYDKKICAFIFAESGGGSLAALGSQTAIIDAYEDKNFTFSGSLDLTDGKKYYAIVYYQNASDAWTMLTPSASNRLFFTLGNEVVTSLESSETKTNFVVFPNPSTHFIQFSSADIVQKVSIIDFSGKIMSSIQPNRNGLISMDVSPLPKGNFWVQIITDKKIKTSLFIKK